MAVEKFTSYIGGLIGKDKLQEAIVQMQAFLSHSPKFNEIIHQEGRFHSLLKAIQRGTIDFAEGEITKNQIRFALLDVLREVEEQTHHSTELATEIGLASEKTMKSILHQGQGDIVLGDKGKILIKGNQGYIGRIYGGDHYENGK